MKIEFGKKDLMIVPETEFEAVFLRRLNVEKVYHKYGPSLSDYIGLKLVASNLVFGRVIKSDENT